MKLISVFSSIVMLFMSFSVSADAMQDVSAMQKRWAQVNYTLEKKAQKEAFESLLNEANAFVAQNPDSAEVIIWRGIIESSYAGSKGGLGALSLAKAAKADFEKAIKLNDTALAGSAYTSLGTLYYKVPGWPLGFGNDDKAETLLKKALTLNPDGIDSNYFYGQFLIDQRKLKEAESYLVKAQNAPARPDRPLADQGRHQEIQQALDQIHSKLKK